MEDLTAEDWLELQSDPSNPESSRELELEATIRECMQRFRNLTSEERTALRYSSHRCVVMRCVRRWQGMSADGRAALRKSGVSVESGGWFQEVV